MLGLGCSRRRSASSTFQWNRSFRIRSSATPTAWPKAPAWRTGTPATRVAWGAEPFPARMRSMPGTFSARHLTKADPRSSQGPGRREPWTATMTRSAFSLSLSLGMKVLAVSTGSRNRRSAVPAGSDSFGTEAAVRPRMATWTPPTDTLT